MLTAKTMLLVLLCVIAFSQGAAAQHTTSGATEQARTYVREVMKKHSLPGLSAAVAVDGKIVWSEGFGEADLENHLPVRPTTKFRLGSVSKLLTIAAVARLYEEGRLDLDAPVQRYVPSFPQKQYPVTTRQLAGHLAGIRHYRDSDPINDCNKSFKTVTEGLQIFQSDPLLFEPGTKHSYSSYGFNLISAVIEGASGKDFLSYMRDALFEPLGMRNTIADRNGSIIKERTGFYERGADKQINNAPCIDSTYKWASGGMLSTAEDMARLGSAFLRPGFLKRETLALVFTPQRLASGEESPMHEGLGWRIRKKEGGGRVFHHGGTIEGGRAFILLEEKSKVVVVLLSNMFAPYGEVEASEVASMFVKQ